MSSRFGGLGGSNATVITIAVAAVTAIGVSAALAFWLRRDNTNKLDQKTQKKLKSSKATSAADDHEFIVNNSESVSEVVSPSSSSSAEDIPTPADLSLQESVSLGQAARSRGNKLFTLGKYTQAIECYTEALGLYPLVHAERALTFGNRAACYLNVSPPNPEAVLEDCTEALKINPLYVKAMERRGRALELLGRLDEALIDFTAACLAEDFKNEPLIKKTESILKTIAESKATARLKQDAASGIRKLGSESTIAEFLASFPKSSLSKTKHTMESLSAAIKKKMTMPADDNGLSNDESTIGDLLLSRGKLLVALKKYDEALNDFNEAISTISKNHLDEVYHWIGTIHVLFSEFEQAEAAFDAALSANPKYSSCLVKKALIHLETGRYESVAGLLDQAGIANPFDPSVPYYRGEMMALAGDFSSALSFYDSAISLDNKFILAQVHKIRAHLNLGDHSKAKDLALALHRRHPKNVEILLVLAECFIFAADFNSSSAKLDEAQGIAPTNAMIPYSRAMLYLTVGDTASAIEQFKACITLDPFHDNALLQLGNLSQASSGGKSEEALQYYEKALAVCRTLPSLASVFSLLEATTSQIKVVEKYPQLAAKARGQVY